jgi:hypothetical protein
MDVVNFDSLVNQGRIITPVDISPDEDYFILGHFDPRRREFKATDYPIFAVRSRDLLTPATRNKDRQITTSSVATSTMSTTYVDLSGMSLTTLELDPINLGASGNYQIHFACDYSVSDLLTVGQLLLNINGVDIIATTTTVGLSAGIFRTNIIWQASPLIANTVIKVRFKIIPGNLGSNINIINRTLMIDGVHTQTII